MKTYLKDLTLEEIIKRLKNGEIVICDSTENYFQMVDGIICYFNNNGCTINTKLRTDKEYYFETEEPFEIKETGLYKTRDGRKVFVSCIVDGDVPLVRGIIQGEEHTTSWYLSGEYEQCFKNDEDIIGKWED